jgi:hypothetical protein
MTNRLFQYDGRFQWWSYTVSHGQLLLRCPPSPTRATQVDVLFKNVSAVSLSTTLDDLEFVDGEGSGLQTIVGPVGGRRLFIVHAKGMGGYVVAGTVLHREWHGTHSERSPLVPAFPPVE